MKTALKFGVGVMFVLSLLGCQFGGPSDKALISELVNTFEEQIERADIDIDGYMSLYSENFSSDYYDKQALRQLVLANSGAFDGVDVSFSRAKIVMNDDGTASVSPVQIKGPSFTITETLTLVKEEGSWFILRMERRRLIY